MESFVEDTLQNEGYYLQSKLGYASIYINNEKKSILCVLQRDYISIVDFKNTFNEISTLVKEFELKVFVFDKRALTTFHQPTMEWYYVTWKIEMLHLGLKTYRKILPEAGWFRKAVEIARKDIENEMDPQILHQFDVLYLETLSEALNF